MNPREELVIGGYFPGPHGIDSLIVGYYDGDKLMYVARTRNGFVPASRRQVFFEIEASRDAGLPLREFAGDKAVPIWRRTQRGENAEGSLAVMPSSA